MACLVCQVFLDFLSWDSGAKAFVRFEAQEHDPMDADVDLRHTLLPCMLIGIESVFLM